jgi:hypothetical protein
MAPPPPPPLPVPQPGVNPIKLLQSLRDLVGTPVKPPEPMYRNGYKPPKKPKPEDIVATGKRLFRNNSLWRTMVFTTLMWADQRLTGMFPEDEQERLNGLQEEWVSPILSAERELIINSGAAQKPGFSAPPVPDSLRGWAQRKEDAALWLREMHKFKHAMAGNGPLEIDECALFTDYGMYVARSVLAPRDSDCPINATLIDPAQVHPVYRKGRVDEVYRVYRATADEIVADYGDFADKVWKDLGGDKDELVGGQVTYEVTEYWDTWYRSVQIGDRTIIPVTEHKYGDCPWTIQYVGRGNPMFTRTATDAAYRLGGSWAPQSGWANDRVSKAVPYLYHRIKNHELYEAVMARVLTGLKKDINPPTIRYRTNDAADKPMTSLDTGPGMTNEAMLGEEKIEALPTVNTGSTTMALQALTQDMQSIMAPKEMFGRIDKSNVTGVAQAGAMDAGQHLLFPMMKSWEMALEIQTDLELRQLSNFGHLAEYGNGGDRKPIIVPAKRRPNGKAAYEFDREIADRVGTRITVTFTKVNPSDWPGMAAAGKNMIDMGVALRRDVRALMTGDTDFDTFWEEWQEEQAMYLMTTNPDFQKLNMLSVIEEQITENDGRPELQQGLLRIRQKWEEMMQPPPQQPGGPPQPGGAPPPPQQPGMGDVNAPFPPGPGVGVPGQVSYPQLGAGPGSQGGQVGRPF